MPPLHGAAGVVVLHAEALEDLDGAVVHAHRDGEGCNSRSGSRSAQFVPVPRRETS
jgi:hypothetical protein